MKFRVPRMKRPEVLQGEWMLFNGDVMQFPRMAAPCLPGGEEIEAEAEAGLEDDEALAAGPALLDRVALREDKASLLGAASLAVVHVAEGLGVRRALLEMQRCRLEGGGHWPSISA